MRRKEIRIGRFYTKNNGLFAREVIGDEGTRIIYRDYSLDSGEPISTRSYCGYSPFSSWVDRECSLEEKARCNVEAMERKTREQSDTFDAMLEIPVIHALYKVLDAIKTEYVVRYLETKGYEVTKADED